MLDTPHNVREITDRIRDLLESDPMLGDLWVTGEIVEATVSRSGHVFFTLGGDGSQLRCVMFRMNALRQRILPSPGAACIAHGKIEIYPADGSLQFYVDLIEEAGIGLAALELELLRQQLEAEGLFAESRKRALPPAPKTIGIVTSQAGAVWHDIQNVIRRRQPSAELLLASATVQGDSAPADIVAAIRSLIDDGRSDVILIARGGGSASDLSAFNDERVLRAVFASPVPVVSAIGHETDWTLLDLVADVRAPTPSAAAELMTTPLLSQIAALMESISLHATRLERDVSTRLLDLEKLRSRMEQRGIGDRRQGLLQTRSELLRSVETRRVRIVERASSADGVLQALSPTKTMRRGYAFVEEAGSGRPVRAASQVVFGDRLRTHFIDGSVESTVAIVTT